MAGPTEWGNRWPGHARSRSAGMPEESVMIQHLFPNSVQDPRVESSQPIVMNRNNPAFLNKLRRCVLRSLTSMVDDPKTDELIRWSPNGDTFIGTLSANLFRITYALVTRCCHDSSSTTIFRHLYGSSTCMDFTRYHIFSRVH